MRKYCKAVIICHGKSEVILSQALKRSLRIGLGEFSRKNGSLPIQINGLQRILNNEIFSDVTRFKKEYPNVQIVGGKPTGFKLFIWMDTDDASKNQIERFISSKMFDTHWLKSCLCPIYCSPNLEIVFQEIGEPLVGEKAKFYEDFIVRRLNSSDQIRIFAHQIRGLNCTNLSTLIEYCLKWYRKSIVKNEH